MRLFISYARVDKPYCVQIAETLNIHDVWFDDRLYAGQQWWSEILRRMDWCEGFVYLLSPESVASEYCTKEFAIAQNTNRHIFPVLIHKHTDIPEELKQIHYADLSNGLTTDAVKTLLNSIYMAESRDREKEKVANSRSASKPGPVDWNPKPGNPDSADLMTIISKAAEAMETGHYDEAIYLLQQAKDSGHNPRFINLDVLLKEAETALEKQTYLREADREYRPILELIKRNYTRQLGCDAFKAYQKDFPDYDPEHIADTCSSDSRRFKLVTDFTLPLLEWCPVTEGFLLPVNSHSNGSGHGSEEYIEHFYISKYPVTNEQFQAFLNASDGYLNPEWWGFSAEAFTWHKNHPEPKAARFKGDDRPRENVNWYEAMAFSNWLSARCGVPISLPTVKQWQRAARGDDARLFPWGDYFNVSLGNTRESKIRMTTQVMRYEKGLSPFGVYDMAGNVWEWCLDSGPKDSRNQEGDEVRAIFGGSFISECERAQTNFHFNLNPEYFYATIGFRLVVNLI